MEVFGPAANPRQDRNQERSLSLRGADLNNPNPVNILGGKAIRLRVFRLDNPNPANIPGGEPNHDIP